MIIYHLHCIIIWEYINNLSWLVEVKWGLKTAFTGVVGIRVTWGSELGTPGRN